MNATVYYFVKTSFRFDFELKIWKYILFANSFRKQLLLSSDFIYMYMYAFLIRLLCNFVLMCVLVTGFVGNFTKIKALFRPLASLGGPVFR